jgi:hypothetical protein
MDTTDTPSGAATLREAARLMRERAEAAEKIHRSPWSEMGAGAVVFPMSEHMRGTVAETYPTGGSTEQVVTTEHIASWHPAVALAVAALLESVAQTDLGRGMQESHDSCDQDCDVVRALAVARTYLGEGW